MTGLGVFSFNTLATPWALALLAGVFLLLVAELATRPSAHLIFSTGEVLARLGGRGRPFARRIPAILRAGGLSALVVAMAGPMNGYRLHRDRADVVDIMLCVDVSGSMQQVDFFLDGEIRDRLYATKAAVRDFLASRKEQQVDRYGMDRVGLILYAGVAWTQCPLTLDYAILDRELDRASITADRKKDGTAIGSAIGLAVRRLSRSEAQTKVIILLTDGLNNRGELDPITAAQVAQRYGVRIYTVGAGVPPLDSNWRNTESPPIDEAMLRRIASNTGGKYYRVTDTVSLRQAYQEISALETTEVEIGAYYEYEPAFVPYVLAGGLLLAAAGLSRRLWFDVVP